ncbi:hypothetical protein OXX80_009539 [Metschnikowia pulcherrima]
MLTAENSDYTQKYHPSPCRDLSQSSKNHPQWSTVADESLSAFNDLKLGKKFEFVIFASRPEKMQIFVDNTSSDDDHESFLAELPENECEYASYDYE